MKNKKILIAVAIVLIVIACAVVGIVINNADRDKIEETTTTTTESTTEKTESQTLPITEESKTETTAAKIEISKKDKENFESMLGQILYSVFDPKDPPSDDGYSEKEYVLYNWENFDCKSSSAKEYAYGKLLTGEQPMIDTMADVFDNEEFEVIDFIPDEDGFLEDPKAILGEYYRGVYAEYVDTCLGTVFNIEPDYDFILRSESGEAYAYYDHGYYYFRGDEGGDGAWPEVKINNIKAQDNGKYLIDATYYISDFEGKEKICDVEVTAEIKTVEGKKLWSFYKIEKQ